MNIHSLNLPQWLVLTVGFGGQALFSMRFIVQWLASERARRSVVPVAFWYLSLGGGSLLLVYALYREDPVFVFGQAAGLVIYVRNLWLIRNQGPAAEHLNASDAPK
jgi:lipid-A-disaccharide synthase-like uncharacterized protein